ncbi:MAG: NUDIX domain-containing protein, partial [bacterium]
MAVKPSDFFVGVIDFFAVLLPGAIIVAIGYPHIPSFVFGPEGILRPIEGSTPQWIAFVVGAYLAGHLLAPISAALDATIYDSLRRVFVPPESDKAFVSAEAIRDETIKGRDAGINAFQWAHATLRLRAPAALVEIERLEADSKFFRSLCAALFGLLLIFLRPGATQPSCGETRGLMCAGWITFIGALLIPVLLAANGIRLKVKERKEQLEKAREREEERAAAEAAAEDPATRKTAAEKAAHAEAARKKAEIKVARKKAADVVKRRDAQRTCIIFGALIVGITAGIIREHNWQSLVLLALSLLCLNRYAERRWKSTKAAYQFVLVVAHPLRPARRSTTPARVGRVLQAGAIAVAPGAIPRLLLVRPLAGNDEWIFPKGHIEPGETPADAAKRELREEAGVIGRPLGRVGQSHFVSKHERVAVTYYLMQALRREAIHESREQRWCTVGEALALLTHPDAKRLVLRIIPLLDAGLLRERV